MPELGCISYSACPSICWPTTTPTEPTSSLHSESLKKYCRTTVERPTRLARLAVVASQLNKQTHSGYSLQQDEDSHDVSGKSILGRERACHILWSNPIRCPTEEFGVKQRVRNWTFFHLGPSVLDQPAEPR